MGESLMMKFLDEHVTDLSAVLVSVGANGLLGEFERWLQYNGYLTMGEHGNYVRQKGRIADD